MYDTVFRARRVITSGAEVSRSVAVRDGRIAAIWPFEGRFDARQVVDLGDDVVLMPGLVDTHVHVNDPGRTEWEGFETATRAAAAGGITTIIDMPLNSLPPTVDVPALELKRKTAQGKVYVDVGFWGGAVPGNTADLRPLHDAGVFGFKCFLLPSGVDEFPPLSAGELQGALREITELGGMLIVHAEEERSIGQAHGVRYADFLASRPRQAENTAITGIIDLAQQAGGRVHILHLSSSDALAAVAAARRGMAITVETCPHYLTFSAEEIPDGATQFKCCPPIREAENRERLWQGLADGVIDCVVSDHSPCTVELKRFDTGDFGQAWGGIAGLQVGLPAVWTGARERGFALTDVVRWMAQRPAELVGLRHKGKIKIGSDADLCVFAPDEEFTVDAATLHHRNPVSAYHGRTLAGVVRSTWLRGREITEPRGRLLSR
jgi:allantoinase